MRYLYLVKLHLYSILCIYLVMILFSIHIRCNLLWANIYILYCFGMAIIDYRHPVLFVSCIYQNAFILLTASSIPVPFRGSASNLRQDKQAVAFEVIIDTLCLTILHKLWDGLNSWQEDFNFQCWWLKGPFMHKENPVDYWYLPFLLISDIDYWLFNQLHPEDNWS